MDKEMFQYQKAIKENINDLINENRLSEAKELLSQYAKVVKNDCDIYSIKGVIAITEKRYGDALKVLFEGLKIHNSNVDLLYNIAYVYLITENINLAIHYYKKAYYETQDQDFREEIAESIKNIGGDLILRVLVGSPICQKPEILRQFLKSLNNLEKQHIDINYLFVDDNENEESSNMLKEFSSNMENAQVYKSDYNDKYVCDNQAHLWNEKLVWKVASFKDDMIDYARNNNYDYLFLIDSDLILHNTTIEHLVSAGKEIISEIFWTKWTLETEELPQVWMKDQYTQYMISRGEVVTNNEALIRQKYFLSKLRQPGTYEVGGLGACTLISMKALQKDISFKEIGNLSFWGEDRHFCIRAATLGIPLYVDTHYPAYHIYRESDLAGVDSYIQNNGMKPYPVSGELEDNQYISRFIKTTDGKTKRFVFDLPNDWWSRFYEYEWASKFVEAEDVSLDAASGICHPFKFYLSDHCKEVYACDIDKRIEFKNEIIEDIANIFGKQAAEDVPATYLENVKYSRASLVELPYEDKKFDKIYCISVLEHLSVEDMWKSLIEFRRTLKDNGKVVLTFDFPTINLEQLNDIIKKSGFKYASGVDFMLLDDALYTTAWNGLCCFRAIIVKDDKGVNEISGSNFDYKKWWDYNYSVGGTSGSGSYGILAEFKAEIINKIISENKIESVMEFGSGDGNQLTYMDYKNYIGLDISATAIKACEDKFRDDKTKQFQVYDPLHFDDAKIKADMVVCLDVLYHITDDIDFEKTLDSIFRCSSKYVILYTRITSDNEPYIATTIMDRDILKHIKKYPEFRVNEIIKQRYPDLSSADFIILERSENES